MTAPKAAPSTEPSLTSADAVPETDSVKTIAAAAITAARQDRRAKPRRTDDTCGSINRGFIIPPVGDSFISACRPS
jgi:hypothetical protein